MNQQKRAYLAAFTAVLLWSTAATAFKIALRALSFDVLLLLAAITSFLVLSVSLVLNGQLKLIFKYNLRQFIWSALLGFLNPFLYYLVLLKAYSLLPAQVAQPLNYLWPVMLVILSIPILKQKMSAWSFVAIFVSFLGVVAISSQGHLESLHIENPLGVVLAAGSSLIWALFWLFNVRDSRPEVSKLHLNFLFGTVYILIYVLIYGDFKVPGWQPLLASVYIGLFEMGITFMLWMKALQWTTTTDKISNMVFLSPFISLLFISLVLGERIHYTTLLGLILIIGGIMIQQFMAGRKGKN